MKLKYYILAICSLSALNSFAQTKDSAKSNTPSISHKMQDAFIGGGFVLGPTATSAQVLYGQSREFIVGLGKGYKFASWNGIGVDVYYKATDFYIKQDSNKMFPNSIQHSSEKISLNNFGGLVFDRFYFGKVYLDAGFYFDWAFYSKHITWDKDNDPNGGSIFKVIDKQLKFVNPTNYGLTFRFGSTSGVSFYFNYRLTKVFKSDLNYPIMPPALLGIAIGLH